MSSSSTVFSIVFSATSPTLYSQCLILLNFLNLVLPSQITMAKLAAIAIVAFLVCLSIVAGEDAKIGGSKLHHLGDNVTIDVEKEIPPPTK